jgi:hypothetical protein
MQEIIGCVKAVTDCKSLAKVAKFSILMEVMGHVSKHQGLIVDTSDMFRNAANLWFQETLLANFAKVVSKSFDWKDWLSSKSAICCLLLCQADLDPVVAIVDGDYTPVASQLARLHKTGRLGQTVFQNPVNLLASRGPANTIETSVRAIVASNFDAVLVASSLAEAEAQTKTMGKKALSCKRTIDVTVWKFTYQTVVTTPLKEWELKFYAATKGSALGKVNGLPMYPHEKLLLAGDLPDETALSLVPESLPS